ncbi:Protein of unknown function (DUF2975) [Mucilaginibacter frigoritolerans]|jgi:hypothetical protein|uniref:DUF2975 domain-containing protein n=1 Tax=Mucilaginibacter frigoritolerans TaxID=652788 RepID=A0A562TPQ4_9SPHI|nr:DUF2975 domain-containing protein [Mucilaginibacter frigoritolerans]TWI94820.1 Protein of unknown function (DUF2975) [Mucilaginibacter frigoritolerans]
MKIKFNTNIVVNVVIGVVVVLYMIPFVPLMMRGVNRGIPGKGDITNGITYNLKPIDPVVSIDLPYYKYISVRDSIKNLRNFKNQNETNVSGFELGYVAGTTGSYILCDTCTVNGYMFAKAHIDDRKEHTQYFIQLPGWKLKATANDFYNDDSVKFFRENNQSYIRKKVIYKSTKNKKDSVYNQLHYVDVPVPFGYNQRLQCLLVPVSESTRNVINIILGVCIFMFVFYMLYLLAAFLKFIADLSKGLSFTDKNVNRLRLIAVSLLIYPCILFLLTLLMRLIFHRYFTPDVIINDALLKYSLKPIGFGLVFLLLYRAFNQGKLLKDEQDLTV